MFLKEILNEIIDISQKCRPAGDAVGISTTSATSIAPYINKYGEAAHNNVNKKADLASNKLDELITRINQDVTLNDTEKNAVRALLNEIFNDITSFKSTKTVEQRLLLITKLAYIYEKNGDAGDHAHKLAVIFGGYDQALKYLSAYAKQNASKLQQTTEGTAAPITSLIVHDACLFALPPTDYDFTPWQKFAKSHMLESAFKKILPSTQDIQRLIESEVNKNKAALPQNKHTTTRTIRTKDDKKLWEKQQQEIKAQQQKELNAAIEKVKEIIKMYKSIKDNRVNKKILTALDDEEYNNYGKNLLQAQLELVTVSAKAGRYLYDVSIEEVAAYYAKYQFESKEELSYFLENHLTKNDYGKFIGLTKVDDDEMVPPVTIDGKNIGHPGYYLRRLNVEIATDAAMAACLGKLSNCCQSLSGESGEPCTIHGLTSRNGGFYIVCNGDAADPKTSDLLICQSWVWRSKTGAMVIDSIEAKQNSHYVKLLVSAFYNQLTEKLLIDHHIPRVCVGTRSGVSHLIGAKNFPTREYPVDYHGYRDSADQILVAAQNKEYLLKSDALIEKFFQHCATNSWGKDSFAYEYIEMLNYAIHAERPDLFDKYCTIFTDGATIIQECKDFIRNISTLPSVDLVNKMIENNKSYLFNLKNNNNITLLLFAAFAKAWDVVKFLAVQPDIDLNIKDKHSNTALMVAANAKAWDMVNFLSNKPGINLNIQDKDGYTVLMAAAKAGELDMVKFLAVQPGINLNIQDQYGYTALMVAANAKALDVVKFLAVQPGIDLNIQNQFRYTALILAVKAGELDMVKFLAVQPGVDLNIQNQFSYTALILAAKAGELDMVKFLAVQPGIDLNIQIQFSYTALILAAKAGELDMVKFLAVQPGIDLNKQDKNGCTALMVAVKIKAWDVVKLLAVQPGIDLNKQDKNGYTALMMATNAKADVDVVKLLETLSKNTNSKNNPIRFSAQPTIISTPVELKGCSESTSPSASDINHQKPPASPKQH